MVQERPLEEGSVHNSISNRPPSAAFHYFDAANARLYLCLGVSYLFSWRYPYILWCEFLFNQCLFFRQRRVEGREMRHILVAGQSYEQTYPQKLGRGFFKYFS